MAISTSQFVIDRVRRITQKNLTTGGVDFTAVSVESPQVEFTGETTEKTDANGVLIASFDTAKGVTFSGELSVLTLPMMASQLGSEMEIASESNVLTGETFEILTLTNHTATMTHTPSTTPAYVYGITSDKSIDYDNVFTVGTAAENASISGATITVPETYTGTMIGVLYEFETTSAVKVTDGAEDYAEAASYIIEVRVASVCNQNEKYSGLLVFPKAKIDNNFTLDLTTEGTHPFSFTAMKDYCADDENLCYFLIVGDE